MTWITGCRPDAKEREELLLEFFEHIITFVSDDVGQDAQQCAIFALYSLFITQRCQPRIKIRMTGGIWSHMKHVHTNAEKEGNIDLSKAIRSLCAASAFVFVVALNHRVDHDTTKRNTMSLWKYSEAEYGVPTQLCEGYNSAKKNLMRAMKNGQSDLDQGISELMTAMHALRLPVVTVSRNMFTTLVQLPDLVNWIAGRFISSMFSLWGFYWNKIWTAGLGIFILFAFVNRKNLGLENLFFKWKGT